MQDPKVQEAMRLREQDVEFETVETQVDEKDITCPEETQRDTKDISCPEYVCLSVALSLSCQGQY